MNVCVRRVIAAVAFASTLAGITACAGKTGVLPSGPIRTPAGSSTTRLSAGTTFTFARIDVPAAGGGFTHISGINDNGEIVGEYAPLNPPQVHGFLDVGGVFDTFDVPGAADTAVAGINDNREIVGAFSDCDVTGTICTGHSFLDVGGVFTTIDFQGINGGTLVSGISNIGEIVGLYTAFERITSPFGQFPCVRTAHSCWTHGFLDVDTVLTTFDHPDAFETLLNGVNANGEIVGTWRPQCACPFAPFLPFLADGHSFTPINVPGAVNAVAYAINDNGDIVGSFVDANFNEHGFVDVGGVFTTLDVPGAFFTEARGINRDGTIVGNTNNLLTGNEEGFIATPTQ